MFRGMRLLAMGSLVGTVLAGTAGALPTAAGAGAVVPAAKSKNCTPGPGLDLAHCNYANADLTGADFAGSRLVGADLSGANLNATNFEGADLHGADLSNAGMVYTCDNPGVTCPQSGGGLNTTFLVNPDFTGADLSAATVQGMRLAGGTVVLGQICVPHLGCANLLGIYPDAVLTGVRAGGLRGTPLSLPAGWQLVDGHLVQPIPPPVVTSPATLPEGVSGQHYSAVLSATGGNPPYRWTVVAGRLPPGLRLLRSSGTITGVPTTPGTYPFTVQVADTPTHWPRIQPTATQLVTLTIT